MLKTETPSRRHPDLDLYPVEQLVAALVDDQFWAVEAVRLASPQIGAAITAALPRIAAGGRLLYVGAGTSGRLGVLDSVELTPTFSWPPERAVAILAGGAGAMFTAVEGAEDDVQQGERDVLALSPQANDVVILLAASGATPYVLGALLAARKAGALTIGIANNVDAPVAHEAQCGIVLDTGTEVISGSTRLKTISSALMVGLHKTYGNLMVDLKPTNAKLIWRAVRLTMHATGASEAQARAVLEQCHYHVKVAIVALIKKINTNQAQALLAGADGSVRAALAA
jgi:N-acetylmuramic acid 6-phosphate etherase